MFVETLIYSYLAICSAMILFNIACIVVFQERDKNMNRHSERFTKEIDEQITLLQETGEISENHQTMLKKKLTRINYLMAFDEVLEEQYRKTPESVQDYIRSIFPVFVYLTLEYRKKSKLKSAYFPYIIKKYGIYRLEDVEVVSRMMIDLVNDSNLYCRENALQALYAMGDAEYVAKALKNIDESAYFHNSKLITDGLLHFQGEKEVLDETLWKMYPTCSVSMKVTILNYFRFSSDAHCEKMLKLMTMSGQNQEVCLACIRYFGKYHYDPAYLHLIEFTEYQRENQWEYSAIAATALVNYPCEKTIEVLKNLLRSSYWYVRFNASESLKYMNVNYEDMLDIFEGQDRYAKEMLRYRMDQKQMEKKIKIIKLAEKEAEQETEKREGGEDNA